MTGDGETGRDDLEHQVGSPLVDGQIATAKHTRSLIQGVVNTFVISLARIVGYVVDRPLAGDSEEEHQGAGIGFWITSMVAELFLGLLASMVVMWFSRPREFRADAGGARLARRRKMIAALEIRRLQRLLLPEASCDLSRGNARGAPPCDGPCSSIAIHTNAEDDADRGRSSTARRRAHSSPAGVRARGCSSSSPIPARQLSVDPNNTPILAKSCSSLSGRANAVMNSDIVKPIPARKPPANIISQVTPFGNLAMPALTAIQLATMIPSGFPTTSPRATARPTPDDSADSSMATPAFARAKRGMTTKLTHG